MSKGDTWNDLERVRRFSEMTPDVDLAALLERCENCAGLCALDVGCAGGRNTELLARAGCDFYAVDTSPAMVRATRARLTALKSDDEIARRVFEASMLNLPFDEGRFDLLVAIGVFHQAKTDDELHRALCEARRVLRPGGRMLATIFSTEMLPPDACRLPGQKFIYRVGEKVCCRVSPDEWRAAFGCSLDFRSACSPTHTGPFREDRNARKVKDPSKAGFTSEGDIEIRRSNDPDHVRISLVGIFT